MQCFIVNKRRLSCSKMMNKLIDNVTRNLDLLIWISTCLLSTECSLTSCNQMTVLLMQCFINIGLPIYCVLSSLQQPLHFEYESACNERNKILHCFGTEALPLSENTGATFEWSFTVFKKFSKFIYLFVFVLNNVLLCFVCVSCMRAHVSNYQC